MTETHSKPYDLEERTLEFAKSVIGCCKKLAKDPINTEMIKQVIRSSGSVGANYREACEALSKKDFLYRMRITRKEAKETTYWLKLILAANQRLGNEIELLIQESLELRKIFSSIISKST